MTPDPTASTVADAAAPTSAIRHALDTAGQYVHDKAAAIAKAVTAFGLSKPAAEIATVAEAAFEAVAPAALAAEAPSVAAILTPAEWQALAALVGEIDATIVRQFLARIPHRDAPAPKAP